MAPAQFPHPDRRAATLLQVLRPDPEPLSEAPAPPGPGSADCRIDLKQRIYRARLAMADSAAAKEHLAPLAEDDHPDLWAGTVPDGVAMGFAARLEEACSLAKEAVVNTPPDRVVETLQGDELRRKRDLLVASGEARIRFSRKGGVLLVGRSSSVHSEDCLWFEARRDYGSLDGFVGADDERPRLFSARFLKPIRFARSSHTAELTLAGALGRGATGWECRVTFRGDEREAALRMQIELPRTADGWRLRTRVRGVPPTFCAHECEPVRELVDGPRGGFFADTLIRSCALLRVGDRRVATPAAAATPLPHQFRFGPAEG